MCWLTNPRPMLDYKTFRCPCLEKEHTLDLSIPVYRLLEDVIDKEGQFINITVPDRGTWAVPRIHIAMHGLIAKELPKSKFLRVK